MSGSDSGFDRRRYAEEAEAFIGELDREYYLHHSGQKPDFQIEPIYDRHAGLFTREAVESLRESAAAASGEEGRRVRELLLFGVDGHLGQATKAEEAALAELEATLEVRLDGEAVPFRSAPIAQANEPDPARRRDLEDARLALTAEHLNPLYERALERSHALARELGWSSYAEMYGELRGIDLVGLAAQTREFVRATDPVYAEIADPELKRVLGSRLGEISRSDLPRFFRAPELDGVYPDERLIESFVETMTRLGIDVRGQANVIFDAEARPTKSPRAFCAPVRVPQEVYLVVPRVGGRDDYSALFHEGGHTQHYANVEPSLPFEFRHLGDNSVTESFAFLFEHLSEDAVWVGEVLGGEGAAVASYARANKLIFLRRYAAKLDYELELHGEGARLARMPERYAELLGTTTRVSWPAMTWLADVDGGFYAACYLRAWALETFWRRELRERFGERWFGEPAAGEWLRRLWRDGQRLPAHELLAETIGESLDFRVMGEEFGV